MDIQEIWEVNVLITPPHLGHSDLCPIITLLFVGFVITLIPVPVSGSCNNIGDVLENCVTLKLKHRRYRTTGVGAVFLILSRAHCITCGLLAAPFSVCSLFHYLVVPYVSHGKPNFVCFYHFEIW